MNVVFILADDLGWSDTTLYGQTSLYETPNIERLAKRGQTFNRAYAASPLCSPTRASILTGQTPARLGLTSPICHEPTVTLEAKPNPSAAPGKKATTVASVSRLDTRYPTLGKLIRDAGYTTGHFGKWHLGAEPYSPLEHGFDVDIPHWPGPGPAGSFVAPWAYPDFKANYPQEHIEDRMAEEAIRWMKSAVKKRKPFYMQYWQFSVHAPFNAKEELIEYYRPKIDPDDPQRSPTYAAMVHSLDDAVGSLLDAIDKAGIANSTAIVFVSDNGGNMYDAVDGTSPTSNFPLRGGKATMYEGGIRVPCIVVWPGVTKAGTRSDEVIQTCDFYPTLLNLLGIDLPENHPVDGLDITPALRGGTLDRDAIYTYFPHAPPTPDWLPPSISVIMDDWKLIRLFFQGEQGAHDYRLYDLAADIGEINNLASAYPERVQSMDKLIENHIREAEVVTPVPNPKFNPKFYVPENIGVPIAQQKAANSVDGWSAHGTCSIQMLDGVLDLDSTGGDPYIHTGNFEPLSGGPFTVRMRIKSASSGGAMVYYNEPANLKNTVSLPVQHDRDWHEVEVEIPVSSLKSLRLDPSSGPGRIGFDWIRIEDASGKTVRQWGF